MKEFKLNEFLTVKLEDDTIKSRFFGRINNIYVKDKSIRRFCSFTLTNIPAEEVAKINKIESIDKFADQLGCKFENCEEEMHNFDLDLETDFWALCSNLQVWVENNYDTKLLHGSLSFPLLKALVDAGDPVAEKMFKEEILLRFKSGYPTTIAFIHGEYLLDYFSEEERIDMVEQTLVLILKDFELLSPFFDIRVSASYNNVYDFLIRQFWKWDKKRIIRFFPLVWEVIEELTEKEKYDHIPKFLIPILPLIRYSEESETFFGDNLSYLLKSFVKVKPEDNLHELCDNLFEAISGNDLLEKYFDTLVDFFVGNPDNNIITIVFPNWIREMKREGFMKRYFSSILDTIATFPVDSKYSKFSNLILHPLLTWDDERRGKIPPLVEEEILFTTNHERIIDFFSDFFRDFKNFPSQHDKFGWVIVSMIKSAVKLGLIDEYFIAFLDAVGELTASTRYRAFFAFKETINKSLYEKYINSIKSKFISLVLDLNSSEVGKFRLDYFVKLFKIAKECGYLDLPEVESEFVVLLERNQYSAYYMLLELAKGTNYLDKHYKLFLKTFSKLPEFDKIYQLSIPTIIEKMTKAIIGTDLENEIVFQEWGIRAAKHEDERAIKKTYNRILGTLRIAKKLGRAKDRRTFNSRAMPYSAFLNDFQKLPDLNKLPEEPRQKIFSESINIIKDTFFENDPEFKRWKEKNK